MPHPKMCNPASCIFFWIELLSIIIDRILQKGRGTKSFLLQRQSYHTDSQLPTEQRLGCRCAEISACLAEESYLGVFVCSSWLVSWGKTREEGRQRVRCWPAARKRQDPKCKSSAGGSRAYTDSPGFRSSCESREVLDSPPLLAAELQNLVKLARCLETLSETTCSVSQPDLAAFWGLFIAKVVWGSWCRLPWCRWGS